MAQKRDARRLCCCVPHCRRTHRLTARELELGYNEWICSRHWPLTSRAWRHRLFLFRRRRRFDLAAHMWRRLKTQAIERAAGIA